MTVFLVRLRALPNVDGIRSLRSALKILLRRFGLRCVSVEVEIETANPKEASNGR
jgi:hypothetical protein